jgi:type IV secretion system protein VirD4
MKKTIVLTANFIIFSFFFVLAINALGQSNQQSNSTNQPGISSEPATVEPNYPKRNSQVNSSYPNYQRPQQSNKQRQQSEQANTSEQLRKQQEADQKQADYWNDLIRSKNEESQKMLDTQKDKAGISNQKPLSPEEIQNGIYLFWLILIFEAILSAGIIATAFKTNHGKKGARIMLIALCIGLLSAGILFVAKAMTNSELYFFLPIIMFIVASAYICAGAKIATIIGLCMMPKQTWQRIALVLVIGIGYALIYLWLINKLSPLGSISLIYPLIAVQGIATGIGVSVIGLLTAAIKAGKKEKEDLHGSARFATKKDLKEFENEPQAGAFVIAPPDPKGNHGKISLPRSLSVMHGLIFGGAGTGKSRGFFMPNCAELKNTSIVVTDPKSELWKFTSGFHQNVLRFAPSEPDSSYCFNWIPLCTDARMSELCARAIMTAGTTQNTDQFWIDAETAFLSAIFAHTATTKYPTPLTAYRLFTRKKPDELLQMLINSPSYVAREQAIIFEQTDARIKGAIVPAVASRMQFMRDQNIQLFTSANLEAPNFGKLRHTPTAVYWCLREQDIARLRPLTSLFFTVLLEQIAGETVADGMDGVPINLMLDEFANIGKIPDFDVTISLARGRNVALWLGIQSLSQLNQTYGNHAAQTIMSNCATKIALHGLDYQTADYVSKMLGEKTVVHQRNSFGIGFTGVSIGRNDAEHRRQLLTPDEVMRIGDDEAIARISNKYPMKLYKGYYNEKPNTFSLNQKLTNVQAEGEEAEEVLI